MLCCCTNSFTHLEASSAMLRSCTMEVSSGKKLLFFRTSSRSWAWGCTDMATCMQEQSERVCMQVDLRIWRYGAATSHAIPCFKTRRCSLCSLVAQIRANAHRSGSEYPDHPKGRDLASKARGRLGEMLLVCRFCHREALADTQLACLRSCASRCASLTRMSHHRVTGAARLLRNESPVFTKNRGV